MITSIRFPEEFVKNAGLRGTREALRGLGKMVVLAGPNGAGKSRHLTLLPQLCRNGARTSLTQLEGQLVELMAEAKKFEQAPQSPSSLYELERRNRQIDALYRQIAIGKETCLEHSGDRLPNIVPLSYSGDRNSIKRTGEIPPKDANHLVQRTSEPGFTHAFHGMHAYFADIATVLFRRDHPRLKNDEQTKRAAQNADRFNELLDKLVGGRVDFDSNQGTGEGATFRGRPFNPVEFSEGEAILATWAIMLHEQGPRLADSILLIDEPENHLHPDACIKALQALQNILGPHGQIWIATHAIQIIAFAGLESVWFVEDGRIAYGGNQVTVVLDRLLGGSDGRTRLRDFLDDAEDIAFRKFVAECLTTPSVAPHKQKDPQETQFVQLVERRQKEGKPLRILDYGAGKGRLAKALYETRIASAAKESLPSIAYFAYNPAASQSDQDECRRHLAELAKAPGVTNAVYAEDLRDYSVADESKMDLIVLCNVLHEIPVREWVGEFGQIARILQGEGVVIIMEDQRMSIGELPSAHGFIVLDDIEVAALFGVPRGVKVRAISTDHGGRLSAIEVQADILSAISGPNIENVLDLVMQRAEKKIKQLRGTEQKTFQKGRKHAYYAMLYMNAKLAKSG